jgi:hypothetical protein
MYQSKYQSKIYLKEVKNPLDLMPHCQPSHCVPIIVVPVPFTASSPLPMHQPYSLQPVAHSRGVWCHGLVISVVVLGARLHSLSPLSPLSEDAPTMHPTSSHSWTCGRCWFVVPWGRWWGVVSVRRRVKEGQGAYLPYTGAVPCHHCLFPAPPLSFLPSFITWGMGCPFLG